ncbi:unnamed protein product [Mesocestoides corti]|uniref:5'-AMP-activated protein kinase subunit beta-1 n=1 Tax=Mesocestoides corti TaxID=53468 RepID=A0A0R3UK62_MESCO|nr:unnamed protein product [Mesocestoides corti]
MMGNTPLHSKRRLSGDAETIACDNTPPHIIMDIPSKRPTLSEHQDSPRSAPIGTGYDRADVDNMAWLFHGASLHDAEHSPHSVCVSSGRPTSLPVPSSAHELPTGGYMDTSGDSRELRSCSGNDGDTLPSDVEMTTSTPQKHLLPTVFRWNGGGHEIYVSGTFNNWQKRIPMARRKSGHVVIVDCPPGRHEYKFFIDGAWYHDPTKTLKDLNKGAMKVAADLRNFFQKDPLGVKMIKHVKDFLVLMKDTGRRLQKYPMPCTYKSEDDD